jgi:putative membrane protein
VLLYVYVTGRLMVDPTPNGLPGPPPGGILALSFWGLMTVVAMAAVVLLIRRLWGAAKEVEGTGRALSILRERYARGELTREQFEQMRRDIEES